MQGESDRRNLVNAGLWLAIDSIALTAVIAWSPPGWLAFLSNAVILVLLLNLQEWVTDGRIVAGTGFAFSGPSRRADALNDVRAGTLTIASLLSLLALVAVAVAVPTAAGVTGWVPIIALVFPTVFTAVALLEPRFRPVTS